MYSAKTAGREGEAYYCYSIASDGVIQLVPCIIYNSSPTLGAAPTPFTQVQDGFMESQRSPYAWTLVNDVPYLLNNSVGYSASESENNMSIISSSGSDASVQLSDRNFAFDHRQSQCHQANKRKRKKHSIRTDDFYRVPYTEYQKQILEQSYSEEGYLKASSKLELARKTNLDPKQIKNWFQNRRAKDVKKGIVPPKPKPI